MNVLRQKGLSLIEVMITLAVFSFGLLALAALMASGLKYNTSALHRSHATSQAYDIADRFEQSMRQIPNRYQGFSLIELLIAVAIIGILAAITIPMYSDYVTRSRRADGRAKLMQVAQELERCYTQFSKYDDVNCSVSASGTVISAQGFYVIGASVPTPSTFTLTATPQNEQADDTDCKTLTLTHLGEQSATGTDKDSCW